MNPKAAPTQSEFSTLGYQSPTRLVNDVSYYSNSGPACVKLPSDYHPKSP